MRNETGLGAGWVIGVLLGALGGVGCHEHAALQAPTRDSSIEERAQSYENLRPLSMHETHITYLRNGIPVGAARRTDYLQLNDGTRVYYPEDITPVVSETSPAWASAKESESARTTGNTLMGVAWAGYVGGATLVLLPVLNRDPGATSVDMTPLYIGLGVMMAGAVTHLVGLAFHSTANDEKATAFETYDAGLRDRLNLCEAGGKAVDCTR